MTGVLDAFFSSPGCGGPWEDLDFSPLEELCNPSMCLDYFNYYINVQDLYFIVIEV